MPRLPTYEECYCTALGGIVAATTNVIQRRPAFSRLPFIGVFSVLGFGVGTFMTQFSSRRAIDRHIYVLDYIRQHPEDFPETTPQKYKDILVPWHPIR